MKTEDPFNQESLNRIFTVSPKHPDRLISRESSWLEFKESFGFKSLGKYIRSAAAFANAKGGYIVYGVENRPHKLVGLKDEQFDKLDPEKLTAYFNEHFDPQIEWNRHLHELSGKVFGLLYIYESHNKPVLCRKGADDNKSLKEGEIYYRYSGRTQTIRYSELKELIEERRKREQLLWLDHLKEIARVGVQDAGIFDLRSGKITGSGGSFLIDESLLSQAAFIREGEFNETKGKPVFKIIGKVQPKAAGAFGGVGKTKIIKTKGIRASDIILAFLNSQKLDDPQSYFTQICYESSAFLPFYFLLDQAKLNLKQAADTINKEPSTLAAKAKLLARIEDDRTLRVSVPSKATDSGRRKLKIRDTILEKKAQADGDKQSLCDFLTMIRTISKEEMEVSYVKKILKALFNQNYAKGNGALNDEIRRCLCYVDWLLNRKTPQAANA